MKKGTIILITLLLMVIGYSAYNTTINLYGNSKIAENISDFKVYISSLKVNGNEVSGINGAKDGFVINTPVNGTIEYSITNDSTEYDTEASLECETKSIWTFDYTGGEQTFVAPKTGTYKIETWGAQGGSNSNNIAGAKGAYSSGNIKLNNNQKLYVYVGEIGKSTEGGYNGGGNSSNQAYSTNIGGAGGGATDIRLINGAWNNFDSLKSRIMVAGGGGGAGGTTDTGTIYQQNPEVTGYGLNGNGGTNRCTTDNCGGLGGDELAGYGAGTSGDTTSLIKGGVVSSKNDLLGENGTNGSFGQGGNGGATAVYYHNLSTYKDVYSGGSGAGGGGGYFGGGGGAGGCGWWALSGGSGGGGSSYISGYSTSKSISSSSTKNNIIYLDSNIHYSGLYFENGKMLSGNSVMPSHISATNMTGNSGNGYARITLISID